LKTHSLDTGGAGEEIFLIVDLERFRGPLDLLLHLIKQQDIDIFEIPISKITRQFLLAIRSMSVEQIDNAGEFMEMAANLLRIKARMLLPNSTMSDDDDPRAELVYRLLEYEQIQEIRAHLSVAESQRSRQFGKGFVSPINRIEKVEVILDTTWDEVYAAATSVTVPSVNIVEHKVTTRLVAMEDKVDLILLTLQRLKRVEFSGLLKPFESKMHGVMTLLAGLELARKRKVKLRQAKAFSELWMYRVSESSPEAVKSQLNPSEG